MERAGGACGGIKRRDLGVLSRPLTGVCCDRSPERLVDPCLELNLFHDSANLPRLALRLRLRLSALSSRSEQPLSISAASLHFFPMLSLPLWAEQHRGAERSRSLLSLPGLTPACAQLFVGAAFASAGSRAPRWVTATAARLRLRRRLAQQWAGAASATCAPASVLLRSKLFSTPQPLLSLGAHGPRLGLLMRLWVATSSHTTPTRFAL